MSKRYCQKVLERNEWSETASSRYLAGVNRKSGPIALDKDVEQALTDFYNNLFLELCLVKLTSSRLGH